MRTSKNGMALITVVLIAALVFASIAGIAASVVPEYKMIASRAASQRALTAAESGLSQVIFNMRNVNFKATPDPGTTAPTPDLEYVNAGDLELLFEASAPPYTVRKGECPVLDPDGTVTPYVTYQAKITKTSGYVLDVKDIPSPPPSISMTVYSLGTVYDKSGGTVLARKAIETEVVFAGGAGVRYGLLAGTSVTFSSSGNSVSHADVWAGGDVTRDNHGNNQGIVDYGSVYAVGQVGPGVVDPATSVAQEGAPSPASTLTGLFTMLDDKYPNDQALACDAGLWPYDGTYDGTGGVKPFDPHDSTMPNMNVAKYALGTGMTGSQQLTANNILAYYLNSTDFSIFADFYSFLKSCDSGSPVYDPTVHPHPPTLDQKVVAFFQQLYAHRNNLFCYYKGDASVTGGADLADLCGAIYVDGNLTVNNGTIGSLSTSGTPPVTLPSVTLRVTGDVKLDGATVNANIYASGENSTVNHQGVVTPVGVGNCTLNGYLVTPLDISVSGTFNVDGSVISEKGINVSGSVNVTYQDRGLGTMSMPLMVTASKGSWKEISFDTFHGI